MKIALTGCTGHIGYNICKTLLSEGHQLNLLVRGNARPFIDKNVKYFKGDLHDMDALSRMMDGVDYVYHLAAMIALDGETEEQVFPVNVDGVQNILTAFKDSGAKRLIHFSSIHAYQQLPRSEKLDENRALVEQSLMVYDRSKAKAQKLVQEYCGEHNLECIILNPTSVTGPEDKFDSLQGAAIKDLYNGKVPVVMNYGFDWVDVRDVVSAAINAMTMGQIGESYILSGKYQSVKELAQLVKIAGGSKRRRPNMPIWVMSATLPLIRLWSKILRQPPLFTKETILTLKEGNTMISSDKASRDLGYNFRSTQETVTDLVNYFKEKGDLK